MIPEVFRVDHRLGKEVELFTQTGDVLVREKWRRSCGSVELDEAPQSVDLLEVVSIEWRNHRSTGLSQHHQTLRAEALQRLPYRTMADPEVDYEVADRERLARAKTSLQDCTPDLMSNPIDERQRLRD